MSNYYESEAACEECISLYYTSVGEKKKRCLEELCRFKTKAADDFWDERMRNEKYLPYILMCRSEHFSDFTSKRLEKLVDDILDDILSDDEAANHAFFLLHACLFKESDKFIEVCRKIGRNYSRLREANINWHNFEIVKGELQPEILRKRAQLEYEYSCESDFFSFLNDTLILNIANAITVDGEYETFSEKVKQLYEDYPEAFAPAGFYAYFIKDTAEAYDKFSSYLIDPLDYPKIMWVLDGLSCNDGVYEQGSPTAFAGPDNTPVHFSLKLDKIDFRWYEFFTQKVLSDAENTSVHDPYYIKMFLRKFSKQVLRMVNMGDDRIRQACFKYFERSSVIAGNSADFQGYILCGNIKNIHMIEELIDKIADRIIEGRLDYCFPALIQECDAFTHEEIVLALFPAVQLLKEKEHSEYLAEQREIFFENFKEYADS